MEATEDRHTQITLRLAQLSPGQITDLLLALEGRIEALRGQLDARVQPVPAPTDLGAAGVPLAIVGLAACLPKAESEAAFGRMLFAGLDAVGPAPADRPERAGLPSGGYLDAIDRFDAAFFGLRPDEADVMDPRHRLALMLAWHALEQAGYADPARRARRTGVFLGLGAGEYEARFHAADALSPAAIVGNAGSIAAGRLCHWLDLTGPAVVIDTACSSSLVTVHMACRSLRAGECDMALAGGVSLIIDPAVTGALAAAGMLGPGLACRAFDAAADGYVRGEGGGLVVLKRLSDAQRDHDRIRAVIRGSAINHDGHASALTAPNGPAQSAVISAALADAGLAPPAVQAVECHGTGTPLGDPIEVEALARAYGPGRDAPLLLGSVKTNIGHLEAAAGIAGLIKMVLALEAGRLPATLHQIRPNPRMAWDRLPVRVVNAALDWPACARRRAGVSSFGFSGTNAHVILEAAPIAPEAEPSVAPEAGPLILAFSAPDADGLRRVAGMLADYLRAHPDVPLAQVAASLALGRGRFAHRAALPARRREVALEGLEAIARGAEPALGAVGVAGAAPARVAFLFSGQGSQWPGMAGDLYAGDAAFRAMVDMAARRTGLDLPGLMFDPRAGDRLTATAHAQPALFVLEHALVQWFAAYGVTPHMVAGHSLGEWSAACVAGVVSFEDALELVAARGRLMAAQPGHGRMVAVRAAREEVAARLAGLDAGLGIAAVNAQDEVVVSGEANAIAALCARFEAAGIGFRRLDTSHAFHSGLMQGAMAPFAAHVAAARLSPPRLPLVSNVTGTTDAPFTDPAYWARQIRAPVLFDAGLETLAALGADVVLEIGPAASLLGLAQRAPGLAARGARLVPAMRRDQPAMETLALALCRLFAAGLDLVWPGRTSRADRLSLPGYPFADVRHWVAARRSPREQAATSPAPPLAPAAAPLRPAPAAAPDAREVRAGVEASLRRALQLDETALAGEAGFFSLGIDSLALAEALATLERNWAVRIARRELFEQLTTPRLLVERVVREVLARGEASPLAFVRRQADPPAAPPVLRPEAAPPAQAFQPDDARGEAFLRDFSAHYVARSAASRRQRETYGAVLADSRAVAGFRPQTKSMLYPIVGVKGVGSLIMDADANRYVDITMGFGVQLFGHNPPVVVEAITRQLAEQGLFLGPQADQAGHAAALICELTGAERALFCNSGTEAVMTALRLARHATGRSVVALFAGSYHGHFDGTLARASCEGVSAPLAGGTPLGMLMDVIVLDYDDPQGSQAALEAVADRLAAVIVEPVQSRRPGLQPRAFLHWLRGFTTRAAIALIFDEVLLGFRAALGGAQAWAGVQADLVTYGKIVGGGLPIGVVAGRRTFLDGIDGGVWPLEGPGGPAVERTFFAGTFNKNPLTMAVASAILTHLKAQGPQLQDGLNARTTAFVQRLNRMLEKETSALRVEHFSSLFRFSGASDLFFSQLLSRGIYVWEGRTCFLSTAHTPSDLDHVVEAVRDSVRALDAAGLMPARAAGAGMRVDAGQSERMGEAVRALTFQTTPGQRALGVVSAFSPQSAIAYNQSLVLEFAGVPDVACLRAALADLVARHDSLRMGFSAEGAEAWIQSCGAIELLDIVVADRPAARAWVRAQAARMFDLGRPPLLRASLVRIGAKTADLVLIQPHIATDGWSMQVLADELGRLYSARLQGRVADLPPPIPYERFAVFARAAAADTTAAAHWADLFRTVPHVLNLPADRPRPALQTFAGDQVRIRLDPALATRLASRARELDCSLFCLCLAAYGRVLGDLSGSDEVTVAIFAAGQPLVGEPGLTGYCLSSVPVRLRGLGGADVIGMTAAALARALAFPAFPLAAIVKASGVRRDPARPPLASVSFNLDRVADLAPFGALTPRPRANDHGSVRWDLNWNLQADGEGMLIEASFNRDLFDRSRVEAWVARYQDILEAFVAGSAQIPASQNRAAGQSVGKDDGSSLGVGMLPVREDRREPVTARGRGAGLSLADHVAAWALDQPDAPALIDRTGTLTYADLARSSGALAALLARRGVGPGDRVAFCLAHGVGPVVAMVAASHLGAAFVPLDPDHPEAHRAALIADSGAKLVVADTFGLAGPAPVVMWDRQARDEAPALAAMAPSDLAYILFTSGSTGRPKGVRIACAALDAYARALLNRLAMSEPLVFGLITSFAADLGYTSILGALVSGGALNVVDRTAARDPQALIAWMGQHQVDVLKIVPGHLAALLSTPEAAAMLPRRALICGGDVLGFDLVDRVRALRPDLRIFNHYGPTETTIGCAMVEVTPSLARPADGRVPVGSALDGAIVEIVDAAGVVLPTGHIGEIRVRGTGVALGYERFASDASSGFRTLDDGSRAYLTGDLGWRDDEGLVHFLGRADDRVKIRGHLVDPDGVAVTLRACPGVVDAAVLVERGGATAGDRLVAAVVSRTHSVAQLTARLAALLPESHRPSRLILVDGLPRTANGKVDRPALLARLALERVVPAQSAPEPVHGSCAVLLTLWRELFPEDAPHLGPDSDFFALGGDSILAIQLAGKAHAAGWRVTPAQIFTHPTLAALACVMRPVEGPAGARGPVHGPVPLTPIQRWFHDIAMPDRRHWALTAVFELPEGPDMAAIRAALMAAQERHDALRLRFPPDDRVRGQVVSPRGGLVFEPSFAGQDPAPAEDEMANRLIGLLDPEAGRIWSAGVVTGCGGRRLVIAVHHLAFDMVSWGILADDLAAALADPVRSVPDPATAWSWWCRDLATRGGEVEAQRASWRRMEAGPSRSVPLDHPFALDLEGAAWAREERIAADLAVPLLAELSERLGLTAQEAVLALVARALFDWAGGALVIDMEGHGREPFDPTIDLVRTIGWFTIRYPLRLPDVTPGARGPWLMAVKEALRAVPRRGIGYGMLRSDTDTDRWTRRGPEISFNFLGEIGRFAHSGLKLVRFGAGRERHEAASRPHRLAFDAWLEAGALVVRCTFGAGHAPESADRLLAGIRAEALACRDEVAGTQHRYTPGDFSGINLSQDDLDALLEDLDDSAGA